MATWQEPRSLRLHIQDHTVHTGEPGRQKTKPICFHRWYRWCYGRLERAQRSQLATVLLLGVSSAGGLDPGGPSEGVHVESKRL